MSGKNANELCAKSSASIENQGPSKVSAPREVIDAIRHGDLAMLQRCIGRVTDFPNGCCDGPVVRRWSEIFASEGSFLAVRWLAANHRHAIADFVPREGTSDLPLLYAAVDRDDSEKYDVIEVLIEAGADLHARGFNDYTPAHLAAVMDDMRALEILRNSGADMTLRTRIDHQLTVLEEALEMVGENSCTRALQG